MASVDKDQANAEAARHVDDVKSHITVGSIAGDDAKHATQHEHNLSFLQALRLYPKAVGWSIFFSLGIIMYVFECDK